MTLGYVDGVIVT